MSTPPSPHVGRRYNGLTGLAKAWQVARIFKDAPRPLVVVTPSRSRAEALTEDIALFLGSSKVALLPAWDTLPLELTSPLVDVSAARMVALHRLKNEEPFVAVTHVEALASKVLPPQFLEETSFRLERGSSLDHDALSRSLDLAGFHHAPLVEERGDMAIRGNVIDLYPAGHARPVRVEFEGGTILEDIENVRKSPGGTTHTARKNQAKAISFQPLRSDNSSGGHVLEDIKDVRKSPGGTTHTAREKQAKAISFRQPRSDNSSGGQYITAIRPFEVDSQRTVGEIEELSVLPVREIINYQELPTFAPHLSAVSAALKKRGEELDCPAREVTHVIAALSSATHLPGIESLQCVGLPLLSTIFAFLSRSTLVVIDDLMACERASDDFAALVAERAARVESEHQLAPGSELFLSPDELWETLRGFPSCYLDHLDIREHDLAPGEVAIVRSHSNVELATRLKTKVGSGHALAPLRTALSRWRKEGYAVAFIVGSTNRAERLHRLLLDIGFDVPILDVPESSLDEGGALSRWLDAPWRRPMVIALGHAHAGVQLPHEKLVFISESEIFHDRSYRARAMSERRLQRLLNSLAQLKENDYVVHADYGVGRYRGLVHLVIEGSESDFLHIDYADSRLYLPVQQIGKIQKFAAAEGHVPVIDKLSSTRWAKTKQRVRDSVLSLAGDLIKLYAARSVAKGWRFDPMGAEDERFADGFPFEETPDQLKAIREVLTDMASDQPMDRLVCGDVGFGKTEVALRAAMKCVQHRRQVAVLAPTTVLVEQHRKTFSERMLEYPVRIGAVSRFYDTKTNRDTLASIASGELDIVIGTHRLLQHDVQFHDLGLLIIDEEHRFGVKQKELLKSIKKQVDVLTLTATPIPRTLHMSLLGIRDISVIATPPHDRRVIRTYVASRSEGLVRDAILKELQRGGQVFFLFNRVQGIELVASELATLVPEARVRFAHGQMSEHELAPIMRSFVQHEFDVLVSTTIIESGLDIPNANTIIIDRADALGLAQLYQLRGRVGRSTRQAYAFLLVPPKGRLGAEAQKRLLALQSLDDLGLGFNLAMQDMEIRGVGNLLGKEQSGNVLAVGFDMYQKIVREAVLHLKGESIALEEELDPEVKLGVPAFIPEYYIPDISERLILYQRLAALTAPEDADLMRAEIEDRFGHFGLEVHNLIEIMRLRAVLRHLGVVKAEFRSGNLALSLSPRAPLDPEKLLALGRKPGSGISLGRRLSLTLKLPFDEVTDPSVVIPHVEALVAKLR